MDYYVVLGIAEDADEATVRSAFARSRAATTRMSALAPPLLNSSGLAKRTRHWRIPNAVAATIGNCGRLVSNRSSLEM